MDLACSELCSLHHNQSGGVLSFYSDPWPVGHISHSHHVIISATHFLSWEGTLGRHPLVKGWNKEKRGVEHWEDRPVRVGVLWQEEKGPNFKGEKMACSMWSTQVVWCLSRRAHCLWDVVKSMETTSFSILGEVVWDCLFIAVIWSNFIRRKEVTGEKVMYGNLLQFSQQAFDPRKKQSGELLGYSKLAVAENNLCRMLCKVGAQVASGTQWWDARCLSCENQSDNSRWKDHRYEGAQPRKAESSGLDWLTSQGPRAISPQ